MCFRAALLTQGLQCLEPQPEPEQVPVCVEGRVLPTRLGLPCSPHASRGPRACAAVFNRVLCSPACSEGLPVLAVASDCPLEEAPLHPERQLS